MRNGCRAPITLRTGAYRFRNACPVQNLQLFRWTVKRGGPLMIRNFIPLQAKTFIAIGNCDKHSAITTDAMNSIITRDAALDRPHPLMTDFQKLPQWIDGIS